MKSRETFTLQDNHCGGTYGWRTDDPRGLTLCKGGTEYLRVEFCSGRGVRNISLKRVDLPEVRGVLVNFFQYLSAVKAKAAEYLPGEMHDRLMSEYDRGFKAAKELERWLDKQECKVSE